MILYHGTNTDFRQIELRHCRPYKDFGRGFYLTPSKHDAEQRAKDKCTKEGRGTPIVQAYQWEEHPELRTKLFEQPDEEWTAFVLNNRKNRGGTHDYDIVIGPVADDGVILSIQLYESKVIDMDELMKRLRYARPTVQYCFCSQRAIRLLQRL